MSTQSIHQPLLRHCRRCLCTDGNCLACVERTGAPCTWVQRDLCSACEGLDPKPDHNAKMALYAVLPKILHSGFFLGSFVPGTILLRPEVAYDRYKTHIGKAAPVSWPDFVATVRSIGACTGLASYHESVIFAFSEEMVESLEGGGR